ncbi:MAG: hypothetical protein WA021_03510 [Minisyncoccia bacterium]
MGNAADDRLTERSSPQPVQEAEFPRYLMMAGDDMKFMTRSEIATVFGRPCPERHLVGIVLHADFTATEIKHDERLAITVWT